MDTTLQLGGLHHVTAITGSAGENVRFYTRTLGLRLVKKTVNQDDTSAYHLYYADAVGSPGTDMTFFDWPALPAARPGSDSISRTWFRVADEGSLDFWGDRLRNAGARDIERVTVAGRTALAFVDFEGQRLGLVDHGGSPVEGEPHAVEDIPAEHRLRGFFAVELVVADRSEVDPILTSLLAMEYGGGEGSAASPHVYRMAGGGAGREVWIRVEPDTARARQGRGAVHHVAFRVADEAEQHRWEERLNSVGVPHSGRIERFYFKSVYFRISGGILFELATDGPGFATDEDMEHLGETLSLPPFLEPQRARIEAGLTPI